MMWHRGKTFFPDTNASNLLALALLVGHCQAALECDLFVGQSTIPNAGLGVFSAVEKNVGDTVGNGDLAFPLMELALHNGKEDDPDELYNPFEDYVWDGVTMGMGKEIFETVVVALWPGLDCAINCNIPLENVKRAFPRHVAHGDSLPYMPHRAKDPAAGAISTYRHGETQVTRHIPPGGELFKFYGDAWFTTRPDMFGAIPLKDDFPRAEELLRKYKKFDLPFLFDFLLEIRGTWEDSSRTLNALPNTLEEVETAVTQGIAQLYQRDATRSQEWLNENAKCIDHIVPRPSTIPGAGQGAFAKRDLPEGTVITGSPCMIVPFDELFDMYDHTGDTSSDDMDKSERLTRQVAYNYCLGHKESSLLLFPYGSGVHYLNHNASQANVRMQWAEDGTTGHNKDCLSRSPEELEDAYDSVGIDYIATREIKEGEELFLDYGLEWEKAWADHIATWSPPDEPTTCTDWQNAVLVRTQKEQETNPYPSTVEVRCHVDLVEHDWQSEDQDWGLYDDEEEEYRTVYGLPCNILERSDDNTYEVELLLDAVTFIVLPDDFADNRVRSNVPRAALFFIDAPYESDLYLEDSFRHPIGLPEDMMPDSWRNERKTVD